MDRIGSKRVLKRHAVGCSVNCFNPSYCARRGRLGCVVDWSQAEVDYTSSQIVVVSCHVLRLITPEFRPLPSS